MHRRGFQADYGAAAVLHELLEHRLGVVGLAVFQTGKGAHAYKVTVAAHHRNGLAQMLGLVAVHHHAQLRLELPAVLAYIQHDGAEAQVERRFLAAQASAETAVEEHQHYGLPLAQALIGQAVPLEFAGLGKGFPEVSYVGSIKKLSHNNS